MAEGYIKKSKQWSIGWLIVWAVFYLVAIAVYPSDPSNWFGWLPSSVVITFGLMLVSFVVGWIFCKQRLNL